MLLFYKGLKKEADIYNPEKMAELDQATIGYGVGNWRLYGGDAAGAKAIFQRIVSISYWPAFGFIAAENELNR
jgi:hypothetical protein